MVTIREIINIDHNRLNMEILKNEDLVSNIIRIYDQILRISDDLQRPPNVVFDNDLKKVKYIKSLLEQLLHISTITIDQYYTKPSECSLPIKLFLVYGGIKFQLTNRIFRV
jgi:hypothetical protein